MLKSAKLEEWKPCRPQGIKRISFVNSGLIAGNTRIGHDFRLVRDASVAARARTEVISRKITSCFVKINRGLSSCNLRATEN